MIDLNNTEKTWYEKEFEDAEDEIADVETEAAQATPPSNVGQHTLLSYLVGNHDAWALAEPIIKPIYFDDSYMPVVQYLIDHTNEYRQIPSIPIIRMKTGMGLDRYDDANDERTTEWLIDEIQTFCRHRATEIEIRRAGMAIQQDNSRQTLETIFQNFKSITEISLEKNLGIEVHRDAKDLLGRVREQKFVPTGYDKLDLVIGGGLPRPGMVLIPGPSGLGKSNMLANLLVNYCERGEFCVYISLELGEDRVFDRIASIMTDTPIRRIHVERDRVAGELERRLTIGDGILRIKQMKMNGTTRSHINAYLKELYMKEGIKPTVLGLDYLDLMHPSAKISDLGNIHVKDKYTSEEFYDLLTEWNMIGITPSQKVKGQNEMDEFDHANVAGGTPKINTSDYVIGIARKDEEMWAYIQKGRYGGDGCKLPFHWNMNTLKITSGDEELFYRSNPRFDPHFREREAEKTALAKQGALNKDIRSIETDHTIADIARRNNRLMGIAEVPGLDEDVDTIEFNAPF